MTGGIMQLVTQGAQDIYLVGNPSITYFKTVYKRHTPFGTEYINLFLSKINMISINVVCLYFIT